MKLTKNNIQNALNNNKTYTGAVRQLGMVKNNASSRGIIKAIQLLVETAKEYGLEYEELGKNVA